MGITVVSHIKLKPGGAELWQARIGTLLATARRWKGCEQMYLGLDKNDTNHLILLERWTSEEDLANYHRWAEKQPGQVEMLSVVDGEAETTLFDDAGV